MTLSHLVAACFGFFITLCCAVSCAEVEEEPVVLLNRSSSVMNAEGPLPILGERTISPAESGTGYDTVYHTIPPFSFVDQDSQIITEASVDGKLYVVDFFFTSCPTICPVMKKNMIVFYEAFKDDDRILILSHSIDTRNDSVPVLRRYASLMDVNTDRWKFLTGNRDHIYDLAREYLVSAHEDPKAPGGYTHSGNFMLIDSQRRIRGYYDGTREEHVGILIRDMKRLLDETFGLAPR